MAMYTFYKIYISKIGFLNHQIDILFNIQG